MKARASTIQAQISIPVEKEKGRPNTNLSHHQVLGRTHQCFMYTGGGMGEGGGWLTQC